MTAGLTLTSRIIRTQGLVVRELDGDYIIMSVENGKYYGAADAVSRRIWQWNDQPIRVGEICQRLLGEFKVDRATCEAQVLAYLNQLVAERLIEIQDEAA